MQHLPEIKMHAPNARARRAAIPDFCLQAQSAARRDAMAHASEQSVLVVLVVVVAGGITVRVGRGT
jgi:hypothetical protein